ncbi:MAG: CoA transferase [Betaproteobacteria bacterium]|nr:CoA transferase [Betaproteobacteria bacterium]
MTEAGRKPGALDGIRILEVANYITGPFASMLLADLGAEIIKIEVPGQGDPFRGWGTDAYSPTFCALNRNKKSLTLNIQKPAGVQVFMQLAKGADVVIENMRPGVGERLGIGFEAVRAINPKIVYCSISGYGSDGPYRDRPGYDTIGQSMGGLMSLLIDMKNPTGLGAPLSDLLTGMYACYAIQGGLLARARHGIGQKVETSLLQATVSFSGESGARYLATGEIPDREARAHMAQVYCFLGSDQLPFVIHLSSPQKFWQGVATCVERPELVDDPRFLDLEARIRNFDALHAILQERFATQARDHWLTVLNARDVPVSPILNLKEVFEHPQITHLGMQVEMTHPKMGPISLVNSGIRMSETPPQMRLPPPALGEDTGAILAALGYDEAGLAALRAQGAI